LELEIFFSSISFEEVKIMTKWYKDGLRFSCQRCNNCCRNFVKDGKQIAFVYLTTKDVIRLWKMKDKLRGKLENNKVVLQVNKNGDCTYWKDGCTIYEHRPEQCRTFPFWSENLTSKVVWNFLGHSCHGVNTGKLWNIKEVESEVARSN